MRKEKRMADTLGWTQAIAMSCIKMVTQIAFRDPTWEVHFSKKNYSKLMNIFKSLFVFISNIMTIFQVRSDFKTGSLNYMYSWGIRFR